MADTDDVASRSEIQPVLVLSLTLIAAWSVWAVGLRPQIPTQSAPVESFISGAAQCVFWLLPCGIYLWRYWGRRWYEPIGLGFPLGARQVLLTLVISVVVASLLVFGTAMQKDIPPLLLVSRLLDHASLSLRAPVFEELVFRGVILSELLNWVHGSKKDAVGLRARYWGVQLLGALVFVFIHWPWWLSHHGFWGTLALSPPVLFTGLILGLVYANTRSIWGCIFLHWLNNELSVLA